jgi:hypothetical protein
MKAKKPLEPIIGGYSEIVEDWETIQRREREAARGLGICTMPFDIVTKPRLVPDMIFFRDLGKRDLSDIVLPYDIYTMPVELWTGENWERKGDIYGFRVDFRVIQCALSPYDQRQSCRDLVKDLATLKHYQAILLPIFQDMFDAATTTRAIELGGRALEFIRLHDPTWGSTGRTYFVVRHRQTR